MPRMKKHDTTPLVLIILDGFGMRDPSIPGNAIRPDTAPHIFTYFNEYPSTALLAHGSAVGLFPGQEGNSEAGHLTIGAGRVVEQDLLHISRAIDNGLFFKNEAFKQALFHAKKYKSRVHVMGLLTDSMSAHANPEHLYALLRYFRQQEYSDHVYLHLFTDGRDAPLRSAPTFLRDLRAHMRGETIATIMGRYYGMDRGKNWDRTEEAYRAITEGVGHYTAMHAEDALAESYARGETDEYMLPTVITHADGSPVVTVQDHDVVFFFNARSDRARQLTKAFVQHDFTRKNPGAFTRRVVAERSRFVAMTDFGPDLPGVFTAFPSPDVPMCLAKAIGEHARQLYISETEKYAHVTYFLNGGYPEPINGEKRELVRSTDLYSYAHEPAMHAQTIVKKITHVLTHDTYDFICVNFPNADMVGHTGNLRAAEMAVRAVDIAVHEVAREALRAGGGVIITADHGNAEEMVYAETGEPCTEHTTNPVPFILVHNEHATKALRLNGSLIDVAPTILHVLGITKPVEMTGETLFLKHT
jgi:2,3-bisphosphoglycerate-independent phosphoglycerate mutase